MFLVWWKTKWWNYFPKILSSPLCEGWLTISEYTFSFSFLTKELNDLVENNNVHDKYHSYPSLVIERYQWLAIEGHTLVNLRKICLESKFISEEHPYFLTCIHPVTWSVYVVTRIPAGISDPYMILKTDPYMISHTRMEKPLDRNKSLMIPQSCPKPPKHRLLKWGEDSQFYFIEDKENSTSSAKLYY